MSMELERMFTYQVPDSEKIEKYRIIREKAKELALLIEKECPVSIERSGAINRLRESMMWANASIALN